MKWIVCGCVGENCDDSIIVDVVVVWVENIWKYLIIIGDGGDWSWVWNIGCIIFVYDLFGEDSENVVVWRF